MSPEAIVSLLDSVSAYVPPNVNDGRSPSVRKQAALVRALIDEVDHCPPSDRRIAGITQQLEEEAARLRRLMMETAGFRFHAA
jgi:hypothetical protein